MIANPPACGEFEAIAVKNVRLIRLAILVSCLCYDEAGAQTGSILQAQNFIGGWTLATNDAGTVIATKKNICRRGLEVYQRELLLEPVREEGIFPGQKATEPRIRDFIKNYRPPAIPYTSETTARRTGREKFNCLEFAEDLVAQASSNDIPAEVIGIKFKGKTIGHACAGFPTAEGQMLYFDSTPGAGRVSLGAHEAWVRLGSVYRRSDGGELAGGAERLPITEIIPVSKLEKIAGEVLAAGEPDQNSGPTRWMIVQERQVQASGIEYAGPETLEISARQIAKWNEASSEIAAARAAQSDAHRRAAQKKASELAAKSLFQNEALAAQNDVYGQLRMGERYAAGDGVEKNPAKARAYWQQAADQGSVTAKDELERFSRLSP